jgi:hypothetical protein
MTRFRGCSVPLTSSAPFQRPQSSGQELANYFQQQSVQGGDIRHCLHLFRAKTQQGSVGFSERGILQERQGESANDRGSPMMEAI